MKPSLPQGNNEQTLPGKLNGSRGAEESAKPKFFPQPGYVLHYITKAAQTPTQTQTPYRKHTPEQQKDGTCTAHFSCRNYCTGDRAGGAGCRERCKTAAPHGCCCAGMALHVSKQHVEADTSNSRAATTSVAM